MQKELIIPATALALILAGCIQPEASPTPTLTGTSIAGPTDTSTPTIEPPTSTPTLDPPTPMPTLTAEPSPTSACPSGEDTSKVVDRGVTFEFGGFNEDSIAEYLNGGGTVGGLVNALEALCGSLIEGAPSELILAEAVSTDVTGDGMADVLVALSVPYGHGYGEGHLIAFVREDSRFRPHILFRRAGAGSAAEGLYEGGGPSLLEIADMNADSIKEIPFAVNWSGYSEFYISQWTGESFRSLVKVFHPFELTDVPYINTSPATAEISDLDDNGTLELIIEERLPGESPMFGSRFRHQQVWAWDGESFALRSTAISSVPVYRIEALIFGELADVWFNDQLGSIELFQQAVFDQSLLPGGPGRPEELSTPLENSAESERLAAYGRFRIMTTLAFLGDDSAARTALSGLEDKFEEGSQGYPYALMAREFWDAYEFTRSNSDGCQAAQSYARRHHSEILDPLGPEYYGAEYILERSSEEICRS